MPEVVLFHSEYGPGPGAAHAADRLRELGHTVHVVELFDEVPEPGETPAPRDPDTLLRAAVLGVARLSGQGLVYAGIGLGAAVAQNVALADEHARGLLMLHGTSDLREDPVAETDGLPVQLHMAEPDPFETEDWLGAWYLKMRDVGAEPEVHRYHGAGHLFTDASLPDFDAEADRRAWAAIAEWLADLEE
ncbi:dienelactone hydrolase [Mangrovactinospora gilvigrisea]|uniref:Dienelactone hydrolase n=1 Tax=Mangrovactinospora gilvigrisea TaxID=1428644 RepID=A0A1J7CA34_9ACTN|nr:dienelactone hydrolase [Mangrovactinospora gilvigrisea]